MKDCLIKKILPYELLPSTKIPTDPNNDLPTNKVNFKLENVTVGVNELYASHQETRNEMR